MEYAKKDSEAISELFLANKLISKYRNEFIELIDNFIKSPQHTLILNFTKLDFIDSAGVGFLFIAFQEATDAKKSFILKNPQKTFHILCGKPTLKRYKRALTIRKK